MKLVSPLNLQKNELQNAVVQNLASAPGSPLNGQFYFDTSTSPGRLKVYDGTAWGLNAFTLNGASNSAVATANTMPIANGTGKLDAGWISGVLSASQLTNGATGTGAVVLANSPAILTPTIADFTNSTHTHTNAAGGGSLTHAAISDFDTQVRLSRLDQLAAPAATVSMGNQVLSNVGTPVNPGDAVNKGYVDAATTGLDVKASVRAASTAPMTLTYIPSGGTSGRGQITAAPAVVDGVTLNTGDRVLLKDQTDGTQNGIYVVTTAGTGANGVWNRATDFNQDAEVTAGAFTFVEEGTVNDNAGFVLTTNNPIVVGGSFPTALTFVQFSGAGSISAGNGLTKSGNTLSAVGTANRISVSGSGIDISSSYVGQNSITTLGTITTGVWNGSVIPVAYGGTGASTPATARTALGAIGSYAADIGDGTTTSVVVTHNLPAGRDVQVVVRENSGSFEQVGVTVQYTSTTTITLVFTTAPTAGQYRCIVQG